MSRRTPAGRQQSRNGHAIFTAELALALKLDRDIDASRLERGDEVVELGQREGIERLGVVARVVEQAEIRAKGRVEVPEPDQVHAGTSQAVGELIGPVGFEERGRSDQIDSEEPRTAFPLRERQPSFLDGDEPVLARGDVKRNETSSALLATIEAEAGTGSHSSVSSATWNGSHAPASGLGAAVTRTLSIRIEPIESLFSICKTARTAPRGTLTWA